MKIIRQLFKKEALFLIKIYLINEHLLNKYFVRWSIGWATKNVYKYIEA